MPYSYMEINTHGEVRCCCDQWSNYYFFGNIFDQDLDEIWNGKKARIFREQFKKQEFEYCNLEICPLIRNNTSNNEIDDIKTTDSLYKKIIRLNFDEGCNVQCVFCRPKLVVKTPYNVDAIYSRINEMLPIINDNCCTLSLNGVGEVFSNKNSIQLIRKISRDYPNIHFSFITNGILCSKELIQELNLEDKIELIECSVHAATKTTYDKIVHCGNFDKVKKNLENLSFLCKNNKIKRLDMNFVITSLNYKEMKDFVMWAKELGAIVSFLPLLKFPPISSELYDYLDIMNIKHPDHEDFVKEMENPVFQSEFIRIPKSAFNLSEC